MGKMAKVRLAVANGFEQAIIRFYKPVLKYCLKTPLVTLAIALAILVVVYSSKLYERRVL